MRRAFVLLMLTALFAALAGCGEAVDTAKQTYSRTTVPAGEGVDDPTGGGPTGKAKANDPAFANDKLRALDPCALLSQDILAAVGKPDQNRPEDFGNCANYMEDEDGKDLSITLYVGETINGAEQADENIGGLPAFTSELDDKSACFVNAITSTNPNFGLRVQVSGKGEDFCGAGRTILTGIVDMIRTDPPEREEKAGSLASADPCALLDPAALTTALGGVETTSSPYTLHWCNWDGGDVSVGVWFRTGYDPKDSSDPGDPVDLGNGLTVYQTAESAELASCRLEWRHRSTGADGNDEIVEVDYDNTAAPAGETGCAAAIEVAKLLVTTLPKP